MKKKVIILLLAVLLIVAVIISFFYAPPGTEVHPLLVPRADSSNVGETVCLSAEEMLQNGQDLFVYVYNPKTGSGRLAILGGDSMDMRVVPLMICEPEWSGADELCRNISGEFSAEIVGIINIGFAEGMHIYNTWYMRNDPLQNHKSEEVINISEFIGMDSGEELQYYFGYLTSEPEGESWQMVDDNIGLRIVGGTEVNCSEAFLRKIEKLDRTADRYYLKRLLGI